MATDTPRLVVVGNPLLDLVVLDGEPLLEKYKLESNDAILAGPEHTPMYAFLSLLYMVLPKFCIPIVTKMSLTITSPLLFREAMPTSRELLPCVSSVLTHNNSLSMCS